MLGDRLEKLEKDLHLLSAMQNLFLTTCPGADLEQLNNSGSGNEVPERDVNNQKAKAKGKKVCNVNVIPPKGKNINVTLVSKGLVLDEHEAGDNAKLVLEQELQILQAQEQVKVERERRIEVEGAGRRVALQLQKTQDDLDREIDTKKGLLLGTLQLKNQMQGYETRINQLELEIGNLKNEKQRLIQDLDVLRHEKQNGRQEYEVKLGQLEQQQAALQGENSTLKQDLAQLQGLQQDLKRDLERKEQSANHQVHKLMNQLNQMLVKCVQIEKEREGLGSELKKAQELTEAKETDLRSVQERFEKLESEHKRTLVLHQCLVAKLRSDSDLQKDSVSQQVSDCRALLCKTKSILVQLQAEKAQGQVSINSLQAENKKLTEKLTGMLRSCQGLTQDKSIIKERLNLLLTEKVERIQGLEGRISEFQKSNKKLKLENNQLKKAGKKANGNLEKELKELKEKKLSTENENRSVKTKLTNTTDNLKILQKISEDQLGTIQKLRTEREDERKVRADLESQLSGSERAESSLALKLEAETGKVLRLEEEVDYLEKRLGGMEDDLRNHNCELFVESTCRNRLQELERTVKARYADWEDKVGRIKAERDKALAAARTAQTKAKETESDCEARVSEILSSSKQATSRLQSESQRDLSEKTTKIYQLESELEKVRLDSAQANRSLLARIQQLQAALNICFGGQSASACNPGQTPAGNPYGFL